MKELHDEHAAALWGYCVRLTNGDRPRAQDVVQETLLRAWRNPKVLDRSQGLGAGVVVHRRAEPGHRRVAHAPRAAGGLYRAGPGNGPGRGPDRRAAAVLGGGRRPEPAVRGPPAGPGGVLLPGAFGGRDGQTPGYSGRHSQVTHALRPPGVAPGATGDGGRAVSTDEFSLYDAAYVLGALSPADRCAFEDHLKVCAACAGSVSDLAGMPGLMSKVSLDQLTEEAEPLPETLLHSLAVPRGR